VSSVRIDRLEVRLAGGSRHRAREIAAELPRSLARQLAGERIEPGTGGGQAQIGVPAVRVAAETPAAETAGAVASAVAGALRAGGAGPGGRR
jgi:hypothetical protein